MDEDELPDAEGADLEEEEEEDAESSFFVSPTSFSRSGYPSPFLCDFFFVIRNCNSYWNFPHTHPARFFQGLHRGA